MFRLSTLFSENAVIQHSVSFPVWGFGAEPDALVTVAMGGFVRRTRADRYGRFKLYMPPFPAGPAPQLKVYSGTDTIIVKNIVFGEVILAGGQSNMHMHIESLKETYQKDYMEHMEDFARVRYIKVDNVGDIRGREEFPGVWELADDPARFKQWAALAVQTARILAEKSGNIVGILNICNPGTSVEAWLSRAALCKIDHYRPLVEEYDRMLGEDSDWEYEKEQVTDQILKAEARFGVPPFDREPGKLDENSWKLCFVPVKWDALGVNEASVVAFRKAIDIPESWAGCDLVLEPGMMEQQDWCAFNGTFVGRHGSGYEFMCFTDQRRYTVPAALVQPGKSNTLLIRNFCYIWIGGLNGPAEKMRIYPVGREEEAIPLAGVWEYQVELWGHRIPWGGGFDLSSMSHRYKRSFSVLYEAMIRPVASYPACGAIWYQGEDNAGRRDPYALAMKALIDEWRTIWCCGNFPFIQVLLAGNGADCDYDPDASWAWLRDQQMEGAELTGTDIISAVDLGDAADLHPQRKFILGTRMGNLLAAKLGYGEGGLSPRIKSVEKCNSTLILQVENAQGLHSVNGKPGTFMIAESAGPYKAAEAEIRGSRIYLHSPEVGNPVRVAYAWSNNPEKANVYNAEGLPLLPYRTK